MTTWFITGISRGLGLALARAVLAQGDSVIGTVRAGRPEITTGAERLQVLTLDMLDAPAVPAAVERAFALAGGRIDVIVNNAGYGLLGAIEPATDAELARLFEVDVFAPFRIIRAALPRLRAQGSGHIINITSIAGRAPGVGSGLYAAAKYALEGLSASLALEVGPLGIKVTAVAPGAFRTDFLSAHSIRHSAADAAYADSVGRSDAHFTAMAGRQAGDPDQAAQAILALARAEDPPLHLLLGSDALRRFRVKQETMAAEIEAWREVTLGTDYPA
ncbi:SDR family NAD(P)-dependent oxidoreductase [Rhodovastum atsumiense]|uniref:SDR family NAD(P)-dependent oxidoreductase n=1 Tax=Rhodovastum atsumiense TaxID=504468 RepID=A0A5M6ISJ3_9PROT|nr:SDR family NAD(P)-dependent oxidoreductase [Rhodovastum atsumiense]KAA5610859.1 SDR family NAD(P)-dependent oxidoreductase [Rhodovastum atsumiense]CAH2602085.1 SDR family NAD(P)-dependent oxidoreductase [Rhodovastum atsumiense]